MDLIVSDAFYAAVLANELVGDIRPSDVGAKAWDKMVKLRGAAMENLIGSQYFVVLDYGASYWLHSWAVAAL